jgi:sugar lactone lactonase YvrE
VAVVVCLSCASGGARLSGRPSIPSAARPILSLHLIASAGPQLSDDATMTLPAAVTANGIGEIIISDKAANSVYKLSPTLEFLAKEGSPSSSLFNQPLGLACDAALNLYVADSRNQRIQVLDHNLRFARSITSYADQNNQSVDFVTPNDISIDGEGNFWVADDNNIVKLDPFFNLLLEISDNVPGPFIVGNVSSVKAARGGLVAIADQGNRRIAIISIAGNYVAEINVPSPQSVALDREGNSWVVHDGKLSAFDPNGNELFSFIGDLPGSKQVWVTFDSGDRLILLDGGLRKVMVYDVIRGSIPNASGK